MHIDVGMNVEEFRKAKFTPCFTLKRARLKWSVRADTLNSKTQELSSYPFDIFLGCYSYTFRTKLFLL